jgi:glucose-1-phosphate thymidylyltransferase
MKIIVPMAGIGKRMRPHTLTVPKPLLKVAGKPIVQRLVEDIAKTVDEKITDIGFIIGDFGDAVKQDLMEVAKSLGAQGHVFQQEEALGTAHAIHCAKTLLDGKVIVAFADTLFKANFTMDTTSDGVIWVQKIEDPSQFGVVKLNENKDICDFVEKPSTFVSDLAIIGIYYFKDGANLSNEIQYLIDNKVMDRGEYQITDALQNMTKKGLVFKPGEVIEWLDCGNKNATVYTNQRVLEFIKDELSVPTSATITNSTIIQPCMIGEGAVVENAVVGPHVTIGKNTVVKASIITNSIVQDNTHIENKILENSMIGSQTKLVGRADAMSVGDFNEII